MIEVSSGVNRRNRVLNDFVIRDHRLDDSTSVTASVSFNGRMYPHPGLEEYPQVSLDVSSIRPLSLEEQNLFALLTLLIPQFEFDDGARNVLYRTGGVGHELSEVRRSLSRMPRGKAEYVAIDAETLVASEAEGSAPSKDILYQWCQALGLVCPPNTALVHTVDFSPQLLRFLQEDPTRLRSLTPDEFERFVAERLDRMGYNVKLAGSTNRKDGGIDLIAVPRESKLGSYVIAGQVKHHSTENKTGRDAVDRLLAWKDTYFGAAMLVTNTAFTKDAVWTAQQERNRHFLRLRDFNDLKRWLQNQWGTEEDWREIPDKIELAPGVVIEVPKPRITTDLGGFKIDE